MYFVAKPNEEAKSFIQAAGLTDETQCRAIGTLVSDLKNYNIWDKMKAIYPMVGQAGVSSSFQFNLKDPALFKGTFVGSWTFASTGASTIKFSGAYMNTGLLASTNLDPTNSHNSYYNNLAVSGDQNVIIGDGILDGFWSGLYESSNLLYGTIATGYKTGTMGSTTAFFSINKPNSTTLKLIKNSTILTSETVVSSGFSSSQNVFLNSYDTTGTFSSGARCAFASIGDGLTDTEAANLYTAVQRFQTTLGRQV
jgi:hypothetical protein